MHITILTGASRGMGLGIARALIEAGQSLLTLQRVPTAELEALARSRGTPIEQWAVDLAEPAPVAERLKAWIHGQSTAASTASLSLINNAALLSTPSTLAKADVHESARALRVSLEAPLVLTAAFLAASDGWVGPRKVLNISSGLGRRAMAGAAGYCAAKAGMDHFSRAVALEEAAKPNGARIVSLAPGVIDTDMQVQLRGSSDPLIAKERAMFSQMKTGGALDSIDGAGAKVVAYLLRGDFGSTVEADVRSA
jgi:NAD(P)-dependent dehydrogenase (short-subunit alcohol dehydrogenase family)